MADHSLPALNLPDVHAEVTRCFLAYDAALLAGDVEALGHWFFDGAETTRFGIGEESTGPSRWRRGAGRLRPWSGRHCAGTTSSPWPRTLRSSLPSSTPTSRSDGSPRPGSVAVRGGGSCRATFRPGAQWAHERRTQSGSGDVRVGGPARDHLDPRRATAASATASPYRACWSSSTAAGCCWTPASTCRWYATRSCVSASTAGTATSTPSSWPTAGTRWRWPSSPSASTRRRHPGGAQPPAQRPRRWPSLLHRPRARCTCSAGARVRPVRTHGRGRRPEQHGFFRIDYDDPRVNWRLADDDVEIAPGVRAVMTPGHTPGHQSFVIDLDDAAHDVGVPGFVLAFDAADLQRNIDDELSPGGMVGHTVEQGIESIRRLKAIAAERGYQLVPGHDPQAWPAFTPAARRGRPLSSGRRVVVIGNLTVDDLVRADGADHDGLRQEATRSTPQSPARLWGLRPWDSSPGAGLTCRPRSCRPWPVSGSSSTASSAPGSPTSRAWLLYEHDGGPYFRRQVHPGRGSPLGGAVRHPCRMAGSDAAARRTRCADAAAGRPPPGSRGTADGTRGHDRGGPARVLGLRRR